MHIRTFRAANLQEALADIRAQMGDDASVLHTRQVRAGWLGWLGRTEVEVTAGLRDTRAADGPGSEAGVDARSIEASLSVEPESAFRSGSVGGSGQHWHATESLAGDLMVAGVCGDVARRWLAAASTLADQTQPRELRSLPDDHHRWGQHLRNAVAAELNLRGPIATRPGRRHVVALVGPTGVGKTTTLAKLAAGFRIQDRRKVGLLTIDTYRIAAVQQLRAYADIMDLPMQVVESPEQMPAAMAKLGDVDLVLIDTAGRSPRSDARVAQLNDFLRFAKPDETHLVVSATSSAESIGLTLDGFASVAATSVILTKLDEAPSTAAVLAALCNADPAASTPLSYVTNGQQVPDDIAVADQDGLIGPLLPRASRASAVTGIAAGARRSREESNVIVGRTSAA